MVSLLALLPAASNTSLSTTYVSSGKGNFGPIISEYENSHEHSEPDVNSGSSISVSTADPFSSSRVVNLIMANPEGDPLNDQFELDAHGIPLPQTRKNPVRNRASPIKMQDFVIFAARHPIPNSLTYQQLSPTHVVSNVHEP
jgi:hypothetical protein